MKKLLLVEGNSKWAMRIKSGLAGLAEITWVNNLYDAEDVFFESDFDLVVLDACVDEPQPDSLPLLKNIKESGFKGPIIAISTIDNYLWFMRKAGASHPVEKHLVVDKVKEILGQN